MQLTVARLRSHSDRPCTRCNLIGGSGWINHSPRWVAVWNYWRNELTDNILGSPLDESDVQAAFNAKPVSAVIVTLNAPRKSDNPFAASISPPRLMADSHANIIRIMKKHGTRKIVTMAAFGVGDSFPNMHFLLRLTVKYSNMSYQFEDHGLVDQEIKASGLDYVLARPTMLAEGDAKAIKEHGDLGHGVGLMDKITRKSVAAFLVDAAERDQWNRKTPVLTN